LLARWRRRVVRLRTFCARNPLAFRRLAAGLPLRSVRMADGNNPSPGEAVGRYLGHDTVSGQHAHPMAISIRGQRRSVYVG
jgi:hypothetical protein